MTTLETFYMTNVSHVSTLTVPNTRNFEYVLENLDFLDFRA